MIDPAWTPILVLALLPLNVVLHELGHYLTARSFGCTAKIIWKPTAKYLMASEYEPKKDMVNLKYYVISFMGIVGVVAFIPIFLLSSDIFFNSFLLILFVGYSVYEVIKRWKDLTTSSPKGE